MRTSSTFVPALLLVWYSAALFVVASAASSERPHSFAILQAANGSATAVVYNKTGHLLHQSTATWSFQWPLVEVSVDTNAQRIRAITYPTNVGSATLYTFQDYALSSVKLDVSSSTSYFDLQFSPGQDATYGIVVTSAYGRQLSRFWSFDNPVNVTAITSLPYGFYVNASTIDPTTTRYFGLLNYFPGLTGFTSRQILAVGAFGTSMRTDFVDLFAPSSTASTSYLLRFVAWSAPAGKLYGLANVYDTTTGASVRCDFVEIHLTAGNYSSIASLLPEEGECVSQPMFASRSEPVLYAFARSTPTSPRVLVSLDLATRKTSFVQTYYDTVTVAAAAIL